MSMIVLAGGGVAFVDEEDEDACLGHGELRFEWHRWNLRPSGAEVARVAVYANYRRFDVFLHRLVAIRMRPEIENRDWRVLAIDGDYLNCRRENLEISVAKGKGRKPAGNWANATRSHTSVRVEGQHPDVAKLWNPGKQWKAAHHARRSHGRHGQDRAGVDGESAG